MRFQKIIFFINTFSVFLFAFLLESYLFRNTVRAQQKPNDKQIVQPTVIPLNPNDTLPTQFQSQNHAYSIKFYSTGEANIATKIVFTNNNDSLMTNFKLQTPFTSLSNISILQVTLLPYCRTIRQASISLENPNASVAGKNNPPPCYEGQEYDYYKQWTLSSLQTKYSPASYEINGDTLTIQLPKPIKKGFNGGLIIFFKSKSYTKKNNFGNYDFSFNTFKVAEPINSLLLSVSTDKGLLLKNALGKQPGPEPPFSEIKRIVTGESDENVKVNNYINNIGIGFLNSFSPSSSLPLKPFVSFNVHGTYASSFVKLYSIEVTLGVIFVALFIIIFIHLLKKCSTLMRYSVVLALISTLISPINSVGYTIAQLLIYNQPFNVSQQIIYYIYIFLFIVIPILFVVLKGLKFGISLFFTSIIFSMLGNILLSILTLVIAFTYCLFPGVKCMF